MTTRTNIKAGKLAVNHSESLRSGLAVKTGVKSGRRAF